MAWEDGTQAEIAKIDSLASDGLTGASNSIAYRIHELERHFHSAGRWFGRAATTSATHAADRIANSPVAFQMDAGDSSFGSWISVLGTGDTPADAGKTYFDPHEFVISAAERAAIYFVQFARGATGDAGYAAGTYTEFVVDTTNKAGGAVARMQTGRAPAGSALWARTMCLGQNTGTISFYIGIHEYEG